VLRKLSKVVYLYIELHLHAQFDAPTLEDVEQHLTRYSGYNMPPASDRLAPVMHVDSIPDDEVVGDLLIGFVVGTLEEESVRSEKTTPQP